jgi:hypothetical protein
LKVDSKYIELKYFPHGFLNYDYPLMMPEASVATEMFVEEMKKFLVDFNEKEMENSEHESGK